MITRLETFKRMLGLKGGRFRQTGMFGSNIIVGTVLGILSGKYIFEEPLQRYWAEKRAEEIAAAANGGGGEVEGGKTSLNLNSTWNFENKLLLLEAEHHFAIGDFEAAKKYGASCESARNHRFLQEEGLTRKRLKLSTTKSDDQRKPLNNMLWHEPVMESGEHQGF
eukprot:g9521.t1 g9521   contig37:145317-146493(+)